MRVDHSESSKQVEATVAYFPSLNSIYTIFSIRFHNGFVLYEMASYDRKGLSYITILQYYMLYCTLYNSQCRVLNNIDIVVLWCLSLGWIMALKCLPWTMELEQNSCKPAHKVRIIRSATWKSDERNNVCLKILMKLWLLSSPK